MKKWILLPIMLFNCIYRALNVSMLRHQHLWGSSWMVLIITTYKVTTVTLTLHVKKWDQSSVLVDSKASTPASPSPPSCVDTTPPPDLPKHEGYHDPWPGKVWFWFCSADQDYPAGMEGWLSVTYQYFQLSVCVCVCAHWCVDVLWLFGVGGEERFPDSSP